MKDIKQEFRMVVNAPKQGLIIRKSDNREYIVSKRKVEKFHSMCKLSPILQLLRCGMYSIQGRSYFTTGGFTVNQFVLASNPLRLMARDFFTTSFIFYVFTLYQFLEESGVFAKLNEQTEAF
jgi:hypothetical protein